VKGRMCRWPDGESRSRGGDNSLPNFTLTKLARLVAPHAEHSAGVECAIETWVQKPCGASAGSRTAENSAEDICVQRVAVSEGNIRTIEGWNQVRTRVRFAAR